MNLIQSVCCFLSRRCSSGLAEPRKADRDGHDAGTCSATTKLRPQFNKVSSQ